MCRHKTRTTVQDKQFLKSIKIEPFQCTVCDQPPPKELPAPKLRVEEENDGA